MNNPPLNASVNVPCPGCGHKSSKTLAWLQSHQEMTCPGCKRKITLNNKGLSQGLAKTNRLLDDLKRNFRKLNK